MKACKNCKIEKDESLFYKRSDTKSGLNSQCKECVNTRNKNWNEANLERVKDYKNEFYQQNLNKWRERRKEWKKDNPDKVKERRKIDNAVMYEKRKQLIKNGDVKTITEKRKRGLRYNHRHKEAIAQQVKIKYENNPIYFAIKTSKQRAKRAQVEGSFNQTEYLEVLRTQNFKCFYCDEKLVKKKTHVDHFIPIHKKGLNYITNIVITCVKCNTSKQDKDPVDYYKFMLDYQRITQERYLLLCNKYADLSLRNEELQSKGVKTIQSLDEIIL